MASHSIRCVYLICLSACWTLGDCDPHDELAEVIGKGEPEDLRELLTQDAFREVVNTPSQTSFQFPNYTPMHYAALMGKDLHLKELLKAGGDPNVMTGPEQKVRPLMVAAGYGHAKAVRVLLKAGARPREMGSSGMTAVTMAARGQELAVLREFRAHGGEAVIALGQKDNNGYSALGFSVMKANHDMLRFVMFEVGLGDLSWKSVKKEFDDLIKDGKAAPEWAEHIKALAKGHGEFFRTQRLAYFMELENERKKESKGEAETPDHDEL